MAALLLVAVIAMAWLWPEGELPSVAQQGTQVEGVVTAVDEQPCTAPAATGPDVDPALAAAPADRCGTATVRLSAGPGAGTTITGPVTHRRRGARHSPRRQGRPAPLPHQRP